MTSSTSAPPQHQINRTWNSGTSEPFTFSFTNTRPETFTNSLNATFSIGGSGVQFNYGSQFASYEPNAIKIWASTATATSNLTINDLRITTPGVAGETVFPGASIAVSQASGTVFQEIIVAGIDFPSVSGGTVTLEGNVTMQFGTDPALCGSALQFHVIATHIPWVDLDVDSNNDGTIDLTNGRRGTDDRIEQSAPGKIIPVGGDRAEMLITLPAGRNATLEIDAAAADKIRVHKVKDRTQNNPLTFSPATANTPAKLDLSLLQPTSTTGTLNTWQLWVEALAPSTTAGDLVFTLTGDTSGPPASDIVRATAVAVDLDADSNNDGRIDPVNEPDGTDDPIEHAPTRGLVVPVYAGDADADGLKDTLDFNGINGRRFAPVKVTLSTGAAYAWTNPIRPSGSPAEDLPGLTFTFTFSDAGLVPAAAGLFRLWKKDAQFVRTEADLIRTGVPIAATELFAGVDAPNARLSLADDSIQYIVVRDDFFYQDLQFKPGVRSALASIGAYAHADLPHAALWRLPKDSLNDLLDMPGQGADPAIIAMLYTNLDATAFPGFKAVLYQDFAAKEDNTYVLAFASTDDSAGEMLHKQGYDWAENVWQGLGWDSFQYQYAMQAATAIQAAMERLVEDGASLTTTGHSLGGGLASAASVVTGAPGITFNAAGLHTNTLRQFIGDPIALETALQRYNQANGLITAFHVDFDFLTTLHFFGSLAGLPMALGTTVTLDGPYDLQAGAAFVIAISFPGILGAVP